MIYILTNLASVILIILILGCGFLLQRKKHLKIFTTLNLALSAVFCALSVVLTNVVGYSFIFGIQMMLGNFFLFLIGMLFGPLIGGVSGLITDTIGSMINLGGGYHTGFMLIKVILGFSGGLVFLFKTNSFWKTKTFLIFSLTYLLTSVLSPFFLFSLYGTNYTMVKFVAKIIRFPFELVLYNSLIYLTFRVSYLLLSFHQHNQNAFWFMKNGSLKFVRKRSLREKYKLDLDGKQLHSRRETTKYYKKINYNMSIGG